MAYFEVPTNSLIDISVRGFVFIVEWFLYRTAWGLRNCSDGDNFRRFPALGLTERPKAGLKSEFWWLPRIAYEGLCLNGLLVVGLSMPKFILLFPAMLLFALI